MFFTGVLWPGFTTVHNRSFFFLFYHCTLLQFMVQKRDISPSLSLELKKAPLFLFLSTTLSCCPVQLERVAAAAGQVSRPSTERPGCSHSLGHLWARQSCSGWGHHCHSLWQIWVSLTSRCYLWWCQELCVCVCSVFSHQNLCESKITKNNLPSLT